jgi:hypothetical protein
LKEEAIIGFIDCAGSVAGSSAHAGCIKLRSGVYEVYHHKTFSLLFH